MEERPTHRTTRSQAPTDPQMEADLKKLEKEQAALAERLEEVESIVAQLNDTSTQPASGATTPPTSTAEVRKLTTQIAALEKQLHAAIGAKHKASANGETKDRTPSVHSLFLSVEGFRKRLKNLEDMEGATPCARFI
jgi:predicted RNase H-like nuclease (RuvC/YqgF family)